VRVGDSLLNMTTSEEVWYDRGQPVQLEFKAEKTHLFEPESGNRILK
jgi:multiple sugar transport system ATP-binding protein